MTEATRTPAVLWAGSRDARRVYSGRSEPAAPDARRRVLLGGELSNAGDTNRVTTVAACCSPAAGLSSGPCLLEEPSGGFVRRWHGPTCVAGRHPAANRVRTPSGSETARAAGPGVGQDKCGDSGSVTEGVPVRVPVGWPRGVKEKKVTDGPKVFGRRGEVLRGHGAEGSLSDVESLRGPHVTAAQVTAGPRPHAPGLGEKACAQTRRRRKHR